MMNPIEFQDLLRQAGFDPGVSDGRWGPKTEAAVESWFLSGRDLMEESDSERWYMTPAMVRLLALIRHHEGGTRGYDADLNNDDRWTLTSRTFDQVRALGRSQVTQGEASSAIGAYQFITATLDWLREDLRLTGSEIMTPAFQDDLAVALMARKRRDYSLMRLARGEIGTTTFALGLAQEWASMPVLAATKRGSRTIERGQSYYAGVGSNRALVTPEVLEPILLSLRSEIMEAYENHRSSDPVVVPEEDEKATTTKGVGTSDNLE